MDSFEEPPLPPRSNEALPDKVDDIQGLVSWMLQADKEDHWWLCLDGVTEDTALSLGEIRALLKAADRFSVSVMHVSSEDGKWTEVASWTSAPTQDAFLSKHLGASRQSQSSSLPPLRSGSLPLSENAVLIAESATEETAFYQSRPFLLGCGVFVLVLVGLAVNARVTINDARVTINDARVTMSEQDAQILDLKSALSRSKESNQDQREQADDLNEFVEKLQEYNKKLQAQMSTARAAAEKSRSELSNAYSGLVAEYNSLNSKYVQLIDQNRQLANAREQESLRAQRAAALELQQASRERQALMKEQRKIASIRAEVAELEMLRGMLELTRDLQPPTQRARLSDIDLGPDPVSSHDVLQLTNQINSLESTLHHLRNSQ